MRRRKVIWSARALTELREIGDYIARDKPEVASQWVEALMAMAEHAALMPLSGRQVPEYSRDDLRELIKRRYRLVYLVTEDQIEVVTIRDGRRRMPVDLLDR